MGHPCLRGEAYGQAIAVARRDAYGLYADTVVELNKVFPRPVFRNLAIDDSRHREWKTFSKGCSQRTREIRHLVVAGRMSLIEPFLQLLRAESGLP